MRFQKVLPCNHGTRQTNILLTILNNPTLLSVKTGGYPSPMTSQLHTNIFCGGKPDMKLNEAFSPLLQKRQA
jgi:hypothetical protein